MIDLDTKQLHSFLRLVETGSFSKAARQIGCSQATMSVRIQKLEEAFGALLFERGHHEVSLTAEGRDLLPDIRSLIDLQDRMARRLQSKRVIGEVRLGIAEGFETALLPELLGYMLQKPRRCRARHPLPAELAAAADDRGPFAGSRRRRVDREGAGGSGAESPTASLGVCARLRARPVDAGPGRLEYGQLLPAGRGRLRA